MDRSFAAAILWEKTVRDVYEERASSTIQPLQWSILRFLDASPTSDARVATIAKYLSTHHAPVSRAVATLLKRNMVEKHGGAAAIRTSPLTLTALGREVLQNDPIHKLAEEMRRLPSKERRMLEKILKRLALKQHALDHFDEISSGN